MSQDSSKGGVLGPYFDDVVEKSDWGEEELEESVPAGPPLPVPVPAPPGVPAPAPEVVGKEYYTVDGQFQCAVPSLYAHGHAPHIRPAALLVYRRRALLTSVRELGPNDRLPNSFGEEAALNEVLQYLRLNFRVLSRDYGMLNLNDLDQGAWYRTHILPNPGAHVLPSNARDLQEFILARRFLGNRAAVPTIEPTAALRIDVPGDRLRTMVAMENARDPSINYYRPISPGALAAALISVGAAVITLVQPPPGAFETFSNVTFAPALEAEYLS